MLGCLVTYMPSFTTGGGFSPLRERTWVDFEKLRELTQIITKRTSVQNFTEIEQSGESGDVSR